MREEITVKTLTDKFEAMAYRGGCDGSRLFDDLLRYIIFGFTPNHPKLEDWNYTKEQTAGIYEMMVMWVKIMERETNIHGWKDVWGMLYEAVIASKGRRSNAGQFFTPSHVCDLMTEVTYKDKEKIIGARVGDPTCGSGRGLLSFNAKHQGNYLVGEDLDKTCCLMTVCNFLIHGCVGEVVWHNTLMPEDYNGGWLVNEGLNDPTSKYYGVPHCRIIPKEESTVWQHWQAVKEQNKQKN